MKKIRTIFLLILTVGLTLTGCQKDCFESKNCHLEPKAGPCFALIYKYYYDQEDNKCKTYLWGGCGGVVPFDSLEDCEQKCECK